MIPFRRSFSSDRYSKVVRIQASKNDRTTKRLHCFLIDHRRKGPFTTAEDNIGASFGFVADIRNAGILSQSSPDVDV